jgi:hypothetical protein
MGDAVLADSAAFAQSAPNLCQRAIQLNREDSRLGLKYILERLTTVGLTMDDVGELQRLGVAVFEKSDITPLVKKIVGHKSARPLAVAIANVVAAAPEALRRDVFLGAVLSAHAARGVSEPGDASLVLFSAVNGAVEVQTNALTQEFLAHGKAKEWALRP